VSKRWKRKGNNRFHYFSGNRFALAIFIMSEQIMNRRREGDNRICIEKI